MGASKCPNLMSMLVPDADNCQRAIAHLPIKAASSIS